MNTTTNLKDSMTRYVIRIVKVGALRPEWVASYGGTTEHLQFAELYHTETDAKKARRAACAALEMVPTAHDLHVVVDTVEMSMEVKS